MRKKKRLALGDLARREQQIMHAIHQLGEASVGEVLAQLSDPPSYSAVRGMLRLLEKKGHVRHVWDGPRHVYQPTKNPDQMKKTAARHLLRTFFNNSMESAVAAMLGSAEHVPSQEELKRLAQLVERARRNGGRP